MRVLNRRTFIRDALLTGALNYSIGGASCDINHNNLNPEINKIHGIGCNFYDAVNHRNLRQELMFLKSMGIPFIRLNFGDYYAGTGRSGWSRYFSSRTQWYKMLDNCVDAATSSGVRLWCSLFWRMETFPELANYRWGAMEDLSSWKNRDSVTRKLLSEIIIDIVGRYKDASAVIGWEVGNEYDNLISMSCNHKEYNGYGITFIDMHEIYKDIGRQINNIVDRNMLLSTGANIPIDDIAACVERRPLRADTLSEWTRININNEETMSAVDILNPKDVFNCVSVHIYPHKWFVDGGEFRIREMINLLVQLCARERRTLFIGEFGCLAGLNGISNEPGDRNNEVNTFEEFLNAIVEFRVPYSAVWNYGYLPNNHVRGWNINKGTKRYYMLEKISDANRRILSQ